MRVVPPVVASTESPPCLQGRRISLDWSISILRPPCRVRARLGDSLVRGAEVARIPETTRSFQPPIFGCAVTLSVPRPLPVPALPASVFPRQSQPLRNLCPCPFSKLEFL